MKRVLLILIVVLASRITDGQQLPIYSQYLHNRFLINPAVAGSDGYTSFNLTAREQWVGYSGAPRTFSFSWQTRFLKRSYQIRQSAFNKTVFRPKGDGKVGMGGYIFSDKNGIVYRTGFEASYVYHLWLANSTQLSMGLAFTGYHFRINEKEMVFEDPDDPWLNDNLRRGIFVPDASFGIYLLNPSFSFGFSTEQLFGAAVKIGEEAYRSFNMNRHYYLMATYSILSGNKIEIQPSVLAMMSELLNPQADIGLNYNYDQTFWAGLAYRTSGAIVANVGFRYTNLYFGYAFDFTLNQIQRSTYGTHEITMALKLGDSARKYRWLDRY